MNNGHKYGAVQVKRDGMTFHSKAEARYYDLLKHQQEMGEIVGFTRQVMFDLGGTAKMYVDFQVFYLDGTHEFVEVKGQRTAKFELQLKLWEARYPWATLRIVDAKDI